MSVKSRTTVLVGGNKAVAALGAYLKFRRGHWRRAGPFPFFLPPRSRRRRVTALPDGIVTRIVGGHVGTGPTEKLA
jgi:hypothetical protein